MAQMHLLSQHSSHHSSHHSSQCGSQHNNPKQFTCSGQRSNGIRPPRNLPLAGNNKLSICVANFAAVYVCLALYVLVPPYMSSAAVCTFLSTISLRNLRTLSCTDFSGVRNKKMPRVSGRVKAALNLSVLAYSRVPQALTLY